MHFQKRKPFLLIFFVCLLALGAYGGAFLWEKIDSPSLQVKVSGKIFDLEVAKTPETRRCGLSGRTGLCSQCGMLFLFETPERQAFWMKDMSFAIDIVWLRGERVVWIERSIPPDAPQIFYPPEAADRVLEFSAGAAQSLQVGDRLTFLPEIY